MAVAFAPAKVNLFLHVGAPGPDGYHPICSLMAFADVGDEVSVKLGPAAINVSGPFSAGLGHPLDNLILKAIRVFVDDLGRPMDEMTFSLIKRLPVAAGLGGGSSDAGAALRLIRDVFAPQVDDARLEGIAARTGADGAACLWGRPVLAEGRGERLSAAPSLPELHAVLVNPRVVVSTPEVYGRLDAAGRFGDVTPPAMPDAFESAEELAGWLSTQRNDLEAPAVSVAPEVGAVLEILRDEPETLLARVSGSGGTCFAVCADDIGAETLAERIEALAPNWWVERCRLGGPWDGAG